MPRSKPCSVTFVGESYFYLLVLHFGRNIKNQFPQAGDLASSKDLSPNPRKRNKQ
jgi:hypothetical protein